MGIKVLQTTHGPCRLESDISRSKMSEKWDISVGELVQSYDSSLFLSIVESLQLIKSTTVEKFVLFSTKLALRKKHFSAQKCSKTHLQASRISKISPW